MSRTFKDQPEYVRTNSKRYDTVERHNHHYPKPQTRTVRKTVKTGVMMTVTTTKEEPVFPSEVTKQELAELPRYESFGGSGVTAYRTVTRTVKKEKVAYVTYEVPAPRPVCEMEEVETRDTGKYYGSCYTRLASYETPHWNRPSKYEARIFHTARRKRHHLENEAMVKLANSGNDLTDYDYEGLRIRTHEGWWD